MNEKSITGIGIMSGSSLDGLDLAIASFHNPDEGTTWKFKLHDSETISFPKEIEDLLLAAPSMSTEELFSADSEFGSWIGKEATKIIEKSAQKPQFIASHGHTVFHNPSKGYSIQLGKGENISTETNLPVITDFRSMDISLGGQGAPLVPVFDFILMSEYDACINLGGISNITINKGASPFAGDICGTNQLLNYLANRKGVKYDKGGEMAKKGKFDEKLYSNLISNPFLNLPFPKSLSNELVKERDLETLKNYKGKVEDSLQTVCTFIVHEIRKVIKVHIQDFGRILLSGGGVLNNYLVEQICSNCSEYEFVIPDQSIINFKEAIAFAFLGALKMNNEINCFASVTGASRDSICGRLIGN